MCRRAGSARAGFRRPLLEKSNDGREPLIPARFGPGSAELTIIFPVSQQFSRTRPAVQRPRPEVARG